MNDETDRLQEYPKEILHSWKSIAKYLNRCVRTARRWEETEALPVRRHKHLKNNTVYAYVSELEKWREQREIPNAFLKRYEVNGKASIANPTFWKNITSWLHE